jgi:hypothetical protein
MMCSPPSSTTFSWSEEVSRRASSRAALATSSGRCFRLDVLREQLLAGQELGVASEQDVRAAPGHVRGDRGRSEPAGLGDDLRFLRVVAGVQDDVLHAAALEQAREPLGLLDGDGAHERRLAAPLALDDLLHDRVELLLLGHVDEVGVLLADERPVRRDDEDLELVDLVELDASVSAVPVMPASLSYMRK